MMKRLARDGVRGASAHLHRGLASSVQPSRTFDWNAHQLSIPRLPLPKLEETLERYIEAVTPLCGADELAATREAVRHFATHDGPKLQAILEERDAAGANKRDIGTATSYVRPFWNAMYLGGRYPVNINSNPALLMHNLPNKTSLGQGGVAGALTAAMSRWCVAMRTNRVEPDFIDRKTPTHGCMEEYKYLFGETRIPRKGQDDIIIDNAARHIVVLRGPHVYAMEVIDRSGAVASAAAISGRFNRLILDTAASASASAPLIGTLTSQERNWWAAEREELIRSDVNRRSVEMIDFALFVVALDCGAHTYNGTAELSWGVTGAGEHRWWDKNFTLQVDALGTPCVNFEHAPYDGATVVRMVEDAWHDAAGLPLPSGRPMPQPPVAQTESVGECVQLRFELSPKTTSAIEKATKKCAAFTDITKFELVDFSRFGKGAMKGWRLSPDGCIQMAYQLAYYRLHGDATISVYESCSTKRFLRGRTEAIRSNTVASSAFVRAADELLARGASGLRDARTLLEAATTKHRDRAAAASQGKGVDRHLFSLLSLANEVGFGADSPLFKDPAWTKLNTSILSTSNVNSPALVALGFGAVCPQGYGLGYTVTDDAIRVAVANYIGDPDTGGSGFGGVKVITPTDGIRTDCKAMAREIAKALVDIERIATAVPASKL